MKRSIIISSILVITALSFSNCTKTDYSYDANDGIISAIRDTIKNVSVNYAFDGVVEFIPTDIKAGFVFYPGAFVDYRCYAPLMAALAQKGFLGILVKPSFDFALFDKNIAVKLKRQYPEADKWYIGGHSLGGVSAAMCLASNLDEFEGLIMLAAYSSVDLSASGKQVVSVYGSNDKVLDMSKYEECRKNLPSSTMETVIEGGCHSYFALYGHQDGDGEATITRAQQLQSTVDAVSKLLPVPVTMPTADEKNYVILDMDLGSSTDDLVTLDMAIKYQNEGKLKLLGVVCDRMGTLNAQVADIWLTYYNHPEIPVGLETAGVVNPHIFIDYSPVLDTLTDKNGDLMFKRSISDYTTLPEGYKLYRKILADAPDHSVNILSLGFLSCIAQLLQSSPDEYSPLEGLELVRQKVKKMYIQSGAFIKEYAGEPDYNILQATEFAQIFFDMWPSDVPVLFAAAESGNDIDYKPEYVISDISWTDIHPLKQVYMQCDCDTGQRMWDTNVLLCLMEGEVNFHLSEPGTVILNDNCSTTFIESETGNMQHTGTFTEEEVSQILSLIRSKVQIKL